MKYTAFLFPGQGAQYSGMGKDFFEVFAVARETFQEANDLLSFSLSKIIFEGPEPVLTETKNSQMAIFVTSVALFRTLKQQLPELIPSVCAGLSLGEYTALHTSGALSFADTLALVRLRGELMNQACIEHPGAMSAVLGLSALDVEEIVRSLSLLHKVWVANYNCPGQTVISGTKEGVLAAEQVLKAKGAKRVLPLQVHGAFHSGLMQSAQDGLRDELQRAMIIDPSIELVMNVPGDYVAGVKQVKDCLIQQVTHSVRWEQSIQAIEKRKPSLYVEIGCGKTLSGMNRKIGVAAPTLSLEKLADLEGISRQMQVLVGG